MSTKKSHSKRSKVNPTAEQHGGLELHEKQQPPVQPIPGFFQVTKAVIGTKNALDLVINAKNAASKWRGYVTKKRAVTRRNQQNLHQTTRTNQSPLQKPKGGSGLDDIHESYTTQSKQRHSAEWNRTLMQYFAKLGQSENPDEELNLDYIQNLLQNGADINCTDKYGQTIFHEVARTWHTDVGRFLLEHKADPNAPDNYGRTPLHVAAAVDYADMCQFLINAGVNKEAKTSMDKQTPVHFAARNDAVNSLAMLLKNKCDYKDVTDYRGRTPIYVAAELDRSEAARFLLEHHAPVGVVDDSGQPALTWMVNKMAPVAKIALDQLHSTDRANRKQYFYLNHLEPLKPGEKRRGYAQMPLEALITCKNMDLVVHPVIKELISTKWKQFGKFGAFRNLIFNMIFILLWSTIALHSPWYDKCHYAFPQDIWKVVIYVLAVAFTAWQIGEELKDFYVSHKHHKLWKNWREEQINRDIEQCHPRWPEERMFLESEKEELDKIKPQYFNDFWNVFDWINYATLLASTITHLIDVFWPGHIAVLHNRIMAANIILVWLRLMKFVRAFSLLGPFIVMLGQMVSDCARFLFLYLEFFIPFACAFWMVFGGKHKSYDEILEERNGTCVAANLIALSSSGSHLQSVEGMESVDSLLFSLFRLTLVDEYDLNGMLGVDKVMTYILLSGWLALSAILCLNIFIALLSDTFVRVYDNARANAVMQKAITVLNIEERLWEKKTLKYQKFIHEQCSPEMLYYDDDAGDGEDELQKATIQNKEKLDELVELWHLKFGQPLENAEGEKYYENSDEEALSENDEPPATTATEGSGEITSQSRRKMKRPSVTPGKLESEVDILRAELVTVERKRRNFERRCLAELQSLKELLAEPRPVQGRLPVIATQSEPVPIDPAGFQQFYRPSGQQHTLSIDTSTTPPPAYPATIGDRVTPRLDASASHVEISTMGSAGGRPPMLPPVRIRSNLEESASRRDTDDEV